MQFKRIEKMVESLKKATSGYFDVHENKVMPLDSLLRFSEVLADKLKCSAFPLRNSIQYIGAIPFTVAARQLLYWRLCANVDILRSGNAIPYYSSLMFSGTEDIRIERVTQRDNRFIISFRVLTGHYAWGMCGHSFTAPGVNRAMYRLGYKEPKYPLLNPVSGLTGLYAVAQLKPETGRAIEDIEKNQSVIDYNRKNIIQYRLHLSICEERRRDLTKRCEHCSRTFLDCPASMHY